MRSENVLQSKRFVKEKTVKKSLHSYVLTRTGNRVHILSDREDVQTVCGEAIDSYKAPWRGERILVCRRCKSQLMKETRR